MTALAEQQRAATQRGYLLFFLFFFLLVTANDFTPAKTRRNARAGASRRHGGASEGAENDASARGTRREEVRDKVRPLDGFRSQRDCESRTTTRIARTRPRVASFVERNSSCCSVNPLGLIIRRPVDVHLL